MIKCTKTKFTFMVTLTSSITTYIHGYITNFILPSICILFNYKKSTKLTHCFVKADLYRTTFLHAYY